MKILHVGSEARHELGCAASLKMEGYDIFYLHIKQRLAPPALRNVYTDAGVVKVPMMEIKTPSLFQSFIDIERFVPNIVKENEFDLVISTPNVPFYIAYNVTRKQKIPLILRVWGIRAAKLFDHIIYAKNYKEIAGFLPSLLHNMMQVNYSKEVVLMDRFTESFLQKLRLFSKKHLCLIYPTYAALYNTSEYEEALKNLIEEREYIFGIVTLPRPNVQFTETNLLKILVAIAKRNPEITVFIAGSTDVEARKRMDSSSLPKNMIFLGRVSSDYVLRDLYIHAKLVVSPIFYRSVSNRLLEALFYRKPILTNSVAMLLHRELEHMRHIFVSDDYARYGEMVRKMLRSESLLGKLSLGAKEAYSSFFSAKQNGLKMKRIIEKLAY